MALQMVQTKEMYSVHLMENGLEYLMDYDLGQLMEIQWELPKEVNLAYSWADQMALLTECCWVHPTENGLEQLMEMRTVMRLAHLSAVWTVTQTVWQMEIDSVQLTVNDSEHSMEM